MMTLSEIRKWLEEKFCSGGFFHKNKAAFFSENKDSIKLKLYTSRYLYIIEANINNHLECIAVDRQSVPGTDIFKCNDLADGKMNDITVNRILQDILSSELVNK